MLPSSERLSRAYDDIEKDMAWMLEAVKDVSAELSDMFYPLWEETFADWGDVVLEVFGFVSRTIFLFLRVFKTPQPLLSVFEYGYTQPVSALAATCKLVLGLFALQRMRRFLSSKKSKRLEQKKVNSAPQQ
jgi:hypothetical protein